MGRSSLAPWLRRWIRLAGVARRPGSPPFDELLEAPGTPRPEFRRALESLGASTPEEFARSQGLAERAQVLGAGAHTVEQQQEFGGLCGSFVRSLNDEVI